MQINHDDQDESFTLARETSKAKNKQAIFDNNEKNKQTKLFSGLDCLPDQLDLFDNP